MATYYIDPTGNDISGNGSIGSPWKTLYKACNTVTGTGDIIHVNAGNYTLTAQCSLAVNVSIVGEGDASNIVSTYQNSATSGGVILLASGTNTSQSISYIKLDGSSLTGYKAIGVYRSNVSIHHCTIVNFSLEGVRFSGTGSTNKFYNNTLTNCGGQPNHTANLYVGGQTNLEIYSNTITQTARAEASNGNCISGYEASYGMKIYNNNITATANLNDGIWKFAVELWLQQGLEMYGNTVAGEVDMGKDVNYGTYDYGIYFHDNIVGWSSPIANSTSGLQLEQTAQGVIIANNTFKNLDQSIYFCQYKYIDDYVEDVWIYSNLIYNSGTSYTNSLGWGIRFECGSNADDEYPPEYYDNINIWNNTIVAYSTYPAARGIELPSHATSTSIMNIDIKNNIIVGFSVAGITARQQDNDYTPAIRYLNIADNVLYGNGYSNLAYFVGFTPTNYTNDGGIIGNPLFVSSPTNLHLSSVSSPAYHTGTVVSFPYDLGDYDGVSYNNPPSIGAYEYIGTIYYVKNGGNDSLAGTTDGTAWAHHPWMSTWTGSVTLLPGDTVCMKRGDTWTHAVAGNYMTVGQSGTTGNYITTTAYGTGAQPRIYHSYVSTSEYSVIYANAKSFLIFDNLNIEHSTGTYGAGMGFYLDGITNPCHDIIITNCEIENIPHSGVYGAFQCYNITVGDDTATTTATTSSYSNHIHDFGYCGVGLMGCNQSTLVSNNKIYYNYIHHSTRTVSGNNAYGLFFSTALSTNGEPHYCYARYNNIQYILTWEGMDCHSGTYLYYQYNYISNCGFQGIAISTATKGTRELHHIYVDGNTIEYNSGWVTGRELGAIVFWNTDYPSASNNIYIRDNTIFYTSRPASSLFNAITVNCVNGITISGNTIYNGPTVTSGKEAIYIYGSYVSNVIIENNFIKQWGIPIKFSGTGLTGSIKIRENIITKPVGQCIGFNNALPASVNMEVYNNVFLNDTYGYIFYNPYGGGTITAGNNILGAASSISAYYWYLGTGTYTIDYNIYWNSSSSSPFYTGGGARTFSVWQGTYGYDAHGYNGTSPSFLNAGGSYLLDTDFQIPVGSIAKDHGINVGITIDYFGNTISANPDIGAHEYTPASPPSGDIYYVKTYATGGRDELAKDGLSMENAWATLSYAAGRVLTGAYTIYVESGSYVDNNRVNLAVGVDILGNSTTRPEITTSYLASGDDGYIRAYSSSNIDGNNTISYLNINGNNLASRRAIYTENRNNIIIHDCNISNFLVGGIYFESENAWDAEPSSYIYNCEVYNCNITNCSDRAYEHEGLLRATGCHDLLVYNNVFTNNQRTASDNGNILTLTFQRGSKFHHNTYYRLDNEGGEWAFYCELFHPRGGMEVYNETFIGGGTWDMGASPMTNGCYITPGYGYTYALSIHDNDFDTSTGAQLSVRNGTEPNAKHHIAIDIEGPLEDVIIYNNHIKNYAIGISMVTGEVARTYAQNRVYIYNNLIENVGYTAYTYTYGVFLNDEPNYPYISTKDNIHVWNNTIIGGAGYNYQGVICHWRGNITNSSIKNNIIYDFDQQAVAISRQIDDAQELNLNNFDVVYNNFYSCGSTITRTNVTSETGCDFATGNQLTAINPGLNADWSIASVSSAVYHAGTTVGLIIAYNDIAWNDPPSMGAFEFDDGGIPPTEDITIRDALHIHFSII